MELHANLLANWHLNVLGDSGHWSGRRIRLAKRGFRTWVRSPASSISFVVFTTSFLHGLWANAKDFAPQVFLGMHIRRFILDKKKERVQTRALSLLRTLGIVLCSVSWDNRFTVQPSPGTTKLFAMLKSFACKEMMMIFTSLPSLVCPLQIIRAQRDFLQIIPNPDQKSVGVYPVLEVFLVRL